MRVLLDTHALLWWLLDDPRLSRPARDTIGNGDNMVMASAASSWEIATKVRIGKLPGADDLVRRLDGFLLSSHIGLLDITLAHAVLAGSLDARHRDPFDRMLAAQSRIESMPLITNDPVFQSFGVVVIW
ncbi:type II toxin-antitoxin system VapC family toxin [Azospirillum sp. ST 5-10]|uniref:type II toxin-antitoxin system VapC family toxin n=1 Tax=unclassified Azospirillum TaxID=2630922 RepID=UPI003F49E45E